MTVLVDRPIWPFRGRRFAHMVSDESFDELHSLAHELGVPERAFHGDHYDIPEELVAAAVALGAEQVEARELVRRLRAAGLRRRPGDGPRPRQAQPPEGDGEAAVSPCAP